MRECGGGVIEAKEDDDNDELKNRVSRTGFVLQFSATIATFFCAYELRQREMSVVLRPGQCVQEIRWCTRGGTV